MGYRRNNKFVMVPLSQKSLGPVTVRSKPFARFPWKIQTATAALKFVAAFAGCSLHRDSVDDHLIDDLKSLGKHGHTINRPADMGGWGDLK